MSDRTQAPPWYGPPGRVEAFSDGVFAIAVTLLVLELRPPEDAGNFAQDLRDGWPTYLAYVAAFAMIGSVWLHHHLVFARVRQVDIGTILTNLLLLFTVSVLPFPTAVMSSAWRDGERSDKIAASLLFALLSIAISVCSYLARRTELLVEPSAKGFLLGERRRGSIAIVGTVIAGLLAFVSPLISLVLFAVTPVYYLTTIPRNQ